MVGFGCIVCAMTAGIAAVAVSLVVFGVRSWNRLRGKKSCGACTCGGCLRSREKETSAGTPPPSADAEKSQR